MVGEEQVSPAEKLRNATTALEPDARACSTCAIRADGTASMVTLEDRHAAVSGFDLTLAVPLNIRVHFETAKNLYLYAWFVYRFYPVAEQQALVTLEFALREHLALLYPAQSCPDFKRQPGLSALMREACKKKLISNDGLRASHRWAVQRARSRVSAEALQKLIDSGAESVELDYDSVHPKPQDYADDALSIFIQSLPKIRNTYAHGCAMLHPTVLGTFEIVTDLVNQLYVAEPLSKK